MVMTPMYLVAHIWCHSGYNSIMETQELLKKDQVRHAHMHIQPASNVYM